MPALITLEAAQLVTNGLEHWIPDILGAFRRDGAVLVLIWGDTRPSSDRKRSEAGKSNHEKSGADKSELPGLQAYALERVLALIHHQETPVGFPALSAALATISASLLTASLNRANLPAASYGWMQNALKFGDDEVTVDRERVLGFFEEAAIAVVVTGAALACGGKLRLVDDNQRSKLEGLYRSALDWVAENWEPRQVSTLVGN